LNRLQNAIYQKPNEVVQIYNSYNENLWYDKNGNITKLERNGEVDDPINKYTIDNLTYIYDSVNRNRLSIVDDATNITHGFKDDDTNPNPAVIDSTVDYGYDLYGNMITDTNKGITQILYNNLNLPIKITLPNGIIEYLYNAAGVKVQKKVTIGSTIYTTDYQSGYQYLNAQLQFFPHAEGYVNVVNGERFNYVYNYTDHLGNIRVSYGLDPESNVLKILEENHYYPFGLKHKNYGVDLRTYQQNNLGQIRLPLVSEVSYKYKYQGQERQDELGLNWDSFKWRNYDYAIGRFMSIDPLSPDFPQWSPYVFSGNLVTISKELEGMEPEFLIGSNGKLSSGVVSLMNAAYGFSVSSLTNSTWIISTDARVRAWSKLTGHPEASVRGTDVMYSKDVVNASNDSWFGLISHEQSHRQDIEKQGNLSFYAQYINEGIFKDYKDISTEKTAFSYGSDNEKVDLADRLLSYKNGVVMNIFQNNNLSDDQKVSMLEAVGNQFKRDVVLQGYIDGAKSSLSNLKDMKWDDETKANVTKILNGIIKYSTKQQEEITKKYGK
jgi:RHS repeat-associated protein